MLLIARLSVPDSLTEGKVYEGELFIVPRPTLEKADNTTVVACIFGDNDKWLFADLLNFVPFSVAQVKAMQMKHQSAKEDADDQKTEG
jgi:hypothetical protein